MTKIPLSLLLGCLAGSLPLMASAAEDALSDIHELTLQWTRVEHQKDQLEANWRRDKPVLEQQLALFEREARELEAVVAESSQEQDAVEQRRLDLLQEQTRLEQEQSAVESTLVQALARLHSLHPQLPPPLNEAWNAELPRLDDPLLTTSEKLRLALELLRQIDDFTRIISLHETAMTLDDGQDYLVRQVYLGLSHGWYVSSDGRFAASGMTGANGWEWTPGADPDAIARIIAIVEQSRTPELVSIPLRLHAPLAGQLVQGAE